jgi:hypothetical protein
VLGNRRRELLAPALAEANAYKDDRGSYKFDAGDKTAAGGASRSCSWPCRMVSIVGETGVAGLQDILDEKPADSPLGTLIRRRGGAGGPWGEA